MWATVSGHSVSYSLSELRDVTNSPNRKTAPLDRPRGKMLACAVNRLTKTAVDKVAYSDETCRNDCEKSHKHSELRLLGRYKIIDHQDLRLKAPLSPAAFPFLACTQC